MANSPLVHGDREVARASGRSSSDEASQPLPARCDRKDSGVGMSLTTEARSALEVLSSALVGQITLKDAQRALRASMSQEALGRCNGSRRAAAALLGVDRRYVQRLVNEVDFDDSCNE